jgi:purine-binding chemotaxis protein CheW
VLTAIGPAGPTRAPAADAIREPVNVVVRVDDEPVSLLSTRSGGVLEVSQVPFEQTPQHRRPSASGDLLSGAYTLPDRLLLALNARRGARRGRESRAA